MGNKDTSLFVLQLEGVPLATTAIVRQGWNSVMGFVDWCIKMDADTGPRPDAKDRTAVATWLYTHGYVLHACNLDCLLPEEVSAHVAAWPRA